MSSLSLNQINNLSTKLYGDFSIATRFDKGEPRLLVTAVDIAEGETVVFDSYKKSDGKRKTVYYPGRKYG